MNPFKTEASFWSGVGMFVNDLSYKLDVMDWTLSPSRLYALLAWAIDWCRRQGVPLAHQPAYLWVMERMEARAQELIGTAADDMRVMVMKEWRDRKPTSIPALLKSYSWFVPILSYTMTTAITGYQNATVDPSGHKTTPGEAVNAVFMGVDRAWQDKQHFQQRNVYGWFEPYPWLDFVRGELLAWRNELKDRVEVPPPSGPTAFSAPPYGDHD
jgi:hypothetical protein